MIPTELDISTCCLQIPVLVISTLEMDFMASFFFALQKRCTSALMSERLLKHPTPPKITSLERVILAYSHPFHSWGDI